MSKYTHHSLALTDKEQAQFEQAKKLTGAGVKKLFMAMIDSILKSITPVDDPAEIQGDGENKSAIVLNVPIITESSQGSEEEE